MSKQYSYEQIAEVVLKTMIIGIIGLAIDTLRTQHQETATLKMSNNTLENKLVALIERMEDFKQSIQERLDRHKQRLENLEKEKHK